AAADRPGPRERAALHRTLHDRRGGRRLGLLQPAGAGGRTRARGDRARREPGRRADLRPWHDQDPAQPGMVHDGRAGDRGRGTGTGDLHADPGLRARVQGVRGEDATGIRGQLMEAHRAPPPDYLDASLALPFFEDVHGRLSREAHAWADGALPGVLAAAPGLDERCIALVRSLGEAGLLRYCVPAAWGGA